MLYNKVCFVHLERAQFTGAKVAAVAIAMQNSYISVFCPRKYATQKWHISVVFLSTEVLAVRVAVPWPVKRNRNEGAAEGMWENVGEREVRSYFKTRTKR
jgi:hypothetical protein